MINKIQQEKFTIVMCALMVAGMSVYNAAVLAGGLSPQSLMSAISGLRSGLPGGADGRRVLCRPAFQPRVQYARVAQPYHHEIRLYGVPDGALYELLRRRDIHDAWCARRCLPAALGKKRTAQRRDGHAPAAAGRRPRGALSLLATLYPEQTSRGGGFCRPNR